MSLETEHRTGAGVHGVKCQTNATRIFKVTFDLKFVSELKMNICQLKSVKIIRNMDRRERVKTGEKRRRCQGWGDRRWTGRVKWKVV